MTSPVPPGISILTPLGRPDPHLADAAASVADLAAALPDVAIEWVLALDGIAPEAARVETLSFRPVLVEAESRTQRGPGHARNRALAAASGAHAVALDSDDALVASGIAAALRLLRDHPDISWVAGDTLDLATGRARYTPPTWTPGPLPRDAFLGHLRDCGHYPIHCSATVIETAALRGVGGWDCSATLARDEDVACLARLSRAHPGWWLPQPLLRYRDNPDSVTHTHSWTHGAERAHLVLSRLDDPGPSLGSYRADLAHQDALVASLTPA